MQCHLCNQQFDEQDRRPKMLPCGHTMCLQCTTSRSSCNIDGTAIPDESSLLDNFYILDHLQGNLRRFYCLHCNDVANSECEDQHDVRSLKKVRQEQITPMLETVKTNTDLHKQVAGRLVEMLPLVGDCLNNLTEEVFEKQRQLQTTLERAEELLNFTSNQVSWTEAAADLQDTAKLYHEGRPALQRLLRILDHRGACHLQMEHGDNSYLAAEIDMSVDCEVTRAMKFLLYLLSRKGNLNMVRPDSPPRQMDDAIEDEEEYDSDEEEEEDAEGAACPEILAERAQRQTASRSQPRPQVRLRQPSASSRLSELHQRILQERERRLREEQRRREQSYGLMVTLDEQELVPCMEAFECPVCMTGVAAGDGVRLKDCLHVFCRDCLRGLVQNCEDAEVKCPHRDEEYSCTSVLTDREIKALVPEDVYDQHLLRSLRVAEGNMENTFHCKTPDCSGWCQYEVGVNQFFCQLCHHENCLQCQVIHEPEDCREYQERIKRQAATDQEARATQAALEALLVSGEAMRCPKCTVVIQKRAGCDALNANKNVGI